MSATAWTLPAKVARPWGSYETISDGASLSGQAHHRRPRRDAVAANALSTGRSIGLSSAAPRK